jgi:hypothetical protein
MLKKSSLITLICIALITSFIVGCSPQVNRDFDIGPPPPTDNNFDVIVVGGDPEGVAAAVSASRNGMTVLLVEEAEALGGLMTLGKLNFLDMNYGKDGTLLTRGIFEEFYDTLGNAFDVEEAKEFFLNMVEQQQSIVLKLNTKFLEPIKEGNNLIGIKVEENGEIKEYFGQRLIDATQDADLAAASGVPYTFAGEDIGEKDRLMGVTLVFELKNVSWPKVFTHLNFNRVMGYLKKDERRHEGANFRAAWGYTKVGYDYQPQDDMMRLRGFNVARQDNGNVLINALLIFGVDALDPESKKEGIERAKVELEHLLPYIRENFVGFEKAELVGTAEQLYVRESRHIIGEYQLTIDDVLENRDQWDRIALGSYPVDIQPTATQRWGTIIGNPDRYSIPFRSLVPLEVENLLVVGRSASFTSLAAGSARVIPIGMCTGEAAGVATAYSINNQKSFREMTKSEEAIKWVQDTLVAQGAYLEPFNIKDPNTDHWAYEGVRTLRSLGLLDGGYDNNYRLEVPIDKWRFQNMLNNTLRKAGVNLASPVEVNDPPSNKEIILGVVRGLGETTTDINEAKAILAEKGILTEQLKSYFAEDEKQPQAAEVIMLVGNVFDYLVR